MSKNKNLKKKSTKVPSIILTIGKTLQAISPNLAAKYASKLFITPIKHKIPKREYEMDKNSKQDFLNIPSIQKQIMTYQYGNYQKKVLLVHGWSGRGTQLVKIADMLIKNGYSTISFDAPAHGKSPGKTSIMPEFIESILELEKQYSPFEFIIGHSLGGMSTLNAIKRGLQVKKAILIGSGDSVNDIIKHFVWNLQLKSQIASLVRNSFEEKYKMDMESYSAYVAAQSVSIPVLIIHDKNDDDVPYTASENIHRHLQNSELFLTENLGHRKILGDEKVISKIQNFIT